MIDIPKTFELCGRKWKVKYVTPKTALKYSDNAEEAHGFCDDPTSTIYLIKGDSEEYTIITFWHELAHGMLYSMGYREHDEAEVDRLGQLLHQFDKSRKGVITLD